MSRPIPLFEHTTEQKVQGLSKEAGVDLTHCRAANGSTQNAAANMPSETESSHRSSCCPLGHHTGATTGMPPFVRSALPSAERSVDRPDQPCKPDLQVPRTPPQATAYIQHGQHPRPSATQRTHCGRLPSGGSIVLRLAASRARPDPHCEPHAATPTRRYHCYLLGQSNQPTMACRTRYLSSREARQPLQCWPPRLQSGSALAIADASETACQFGTWRQH
jgi:hypothetical protein